MKAKLLIGFIESQTKLLRNSNRKRQNLTWRGQAGKAEEAFLRALAAERSHLPSLTALSWLHLAQGGGPRRCIYTWGAVCLRKQGECDCAS